jgi:hypothetical protein
VVGALQRRAGALPARHAGRDALLDTVARTADRYARDISMQVLQQNEGEPATAEARA